MEDYPGSSGWALNAITSVLYKRKGEGDLRVEEEGNVMMEAGVEKTT